VITSSSVTTAAVTRKLRWEAIVVVSRHCAMLKWPAPSIKMKYQVLTDLLYWFLSSRRKVEGDRPYSCGNQLESDYAASELLHSWRMHTAFFLYENE
jgi:hypothetical protein